MTFSSSLTNATTSLILDTSVLINLQASRFGECIIAALPYDILVPCIVLGELTRPTEKGGGDESFVETLSSEKLTQSAPLSDTEYKIYNRIVAGGTSLGDGEAASIAIAAIRGFYAAIDDRKARAYATSGFEGIRLCWSIDLLLHPGVVSALGSGRVSDAVFYALRDGRMCIHESHCDSVVEVIGKDRAIQCSSLPGFKKRKNEWTKD